jgi:hypothetical protein
MPVTIPDTLPTAAIDKSLLVQLPTPPGLDNVVVAPVQTVVVPVIAPGEPFTANVAKAEQPDTV